jgi:hypothetical protein
LGSSARTRLLDPEITDAVDDTLLSRKGDTQLKQEYTTATKQNTNASCPLCGNRWEEYHPTNCQCNGPMRTTRHTLGKRVIVDQFRSIPRLFVEYEKPGIAKYDEDGKSEIIIPDFTFTWDSLG